MKRHLLFTLATSRLILLAVIICTGGCCVHLVTSVRNETGRDVLLAWNHGTNETSSVAIPFGKTRTTCGVVGSPADESWIIFDGQTRYVFSDLSAIAKLPDDFVSSSRFTSDFPCLRVTRHVGLSSNMTICAGGHIRPAVPQPPGFPIHFTKEQKTDDPQMTK
jgi:hypothetical protein